MNEEQEQRDVRDALERLLGRESLPEGAEIKQTPLPTGDLPAELVYSFSCHFNLLHLETVLPMAVVYQIRQHFLAAIGLAYQMGKRSGH